MALLQLPQATHSHETLLKVPKLALGLGIPLLHGVKQVSIIHWKPEHFGLARSWSSVGCACSCLRGSGDLQPLLSPLTQHQQLQGLWALRGSTKGCVFWFGIISR